MTLNPQMIAPFQTGLETSLEPWLAAPDSFRDAVNVHVRDARIEKRGGYRVFGQLQTLGSSVGINAITQANPGEVTTAANHGYMTGDIVFISGVGGMTEVNDLYYTITVTGATTFTLGIDTSAFTAYTAGGTVYLRTASTDRVMGIYRWIAADGSRRTLAFDTDRAYRYDTAADAFFALDATAPLNGGDTDYIWAENWQSQGISNRLYFTNGLPYDGTFNGIRYYNANDSLNTTTSLVPFLDTGMTRSLLGCKLLFVTRQLLVALNTFEGTAGSPTNFPQRARWCQRQTPSNWVDNSPGGGGFVDAPTGEQIISARALQNQIIVFFTDSVWALRPLPNPAIPLRWEKINSFRACNGKMASVGYDRYVNALGVRGITATDGIETRRIDQKIDLFVPDNINIGEFGKVFCQRNYQEKRWITLYPSGTSEEIDSALVFDDDSAAFTTYAIALNCLGYGNLSRDFGLNDFTAANNLDFALDDFDQETLFSFFFLDNADIFLGGDTGGFVYALDNTRSDNGTAITIDLKTNSWNPFRQQGIECQLSYVDIYIDTDQCARVNVQFFKDDFDNPYTEQQMTFLPNLNFVGDVINITQANPANVNVAEHGLTTGDSVWIYNVLGMTEINGTKYTITVVDNDNFTLDGVDSTAFTAFTSSGKVFTEPFVQKRVWKRVYAGGIGYEHSMRIYSDILSDPIQIHAFKPYFKPRGRRTVT